jgi:hypothetical protein
VNEYTARNGVKIEWDGDTLKVDTLAYFDRWGTHYPALAEFFRAEEDERLGRWRWPENEGYIVYPDGRYPHLVSVIDESTGLREVRSKSKAGHKRDNFERAAAAYFDAHPEPKPWHDAKEGEVWVITSAGGSRQDLALVGIEDDAFVLATGESWPKNADFLTAGRRIYPEGDS